jgi:hypothetical protein
MANRGKVIWLGMENQVVWQQKAAWDSGILQCSAGLYWILSACPTGEMWPSKGINSGEI